MTLPPLNGRSDAINLSGSKRRWASLIRPGGRAAIWHVDPRWRAASTYQLEFEKYASDSGGVVWVVQIARSNGAAMTMTSLGKVSAKLLLFTLTKAEKSIAESGQNRPDSQLHVAARSSPVRAGSGRH